VYQVVRFPQKGEPSPGYSFPNPTSKATFDQDQHEKSCAEAPLTPPALPDTLGEGPASLLLQFAGGVMACGSSKACALWKPGFRSWTEAAAMQHSHLGAAAAALSTEGAIVVGGKDDWTKVEKGLSNKLKLFIRNIVFTFFQCEILSHGEWRQCTDASEGQYGGRALAVSSQIVLVIGGRDEQGQPSKTVMRFVVQRLQELNIIK
jgi:hypothetical protein